MSPSPMSARVLCAAMILAGLLSGCGGGGSSSTGALFLTLTPDLPQAIDQGQSYTFSAFVSNDTTNSGVKWTLTGTQCSGTTCGSLVNVSKTAVTYQAPAKVTTPLQATLTATAVANSQATATITVSVYPPPQILTTTLPNAANGVSYSQQILITGGVPPIVYSVSSGALPGGLSLNTNGYIYGRPTVSSGTFNFTVKISDQGLPPLAATRNFSMTIEPPPPLSLTTTSLPTAAQGSHYDSPLVAAGGVPPLTWGIQSGNLPPGLSLDTSLGQISGIPTTQGNFTFTPQVSDSAIPSQTAVSAQPITLTVGPPNPLTIATTLLPPGLTATPYSTTLLANGGVGPFVWQITSGILPSGLAMDPATGVLSGTPTAASQNTFSVQVTDSEPVPQTASATLTLTIAASTNNNRLLEGNYVFAFSGYNSKGPVALGGVFTADGGGTIVAGVEDANNTVGPVLDQAVTGKYSIGSDGRGSFTLTATTTSGTTVSVASTYQLAFDANGNAQFTESDNSGTRGTGILRKQASILFTPANFDGNFAFGLAGLDSAGKRQALAGFLHADGASGFDSGNVDTNDAGTLGTNQSGIGGSFQIDPDGRGSATLDLSTPGTLTFSIYMASPSDVLFVGMDTLGTSAPMTVGEALQQTGPSFSLGSLDAPGVVTTTGLDASGNSSVLAGLLTGNGAGTLSESYDANDAGTITAQGSTTGSYTVSSNGRVALTGLGSKLAVVYLVAPNQGFVIGQDAAASSGVLEAQTPGISFAPASFTSYFTFGSPSMGPPNTATKKVNILVGSFLSDGISAIAGKLDLSAAIGSPSLNLALKGTFTVAANGRGTIAVSSPTALPTQLVFYMVSPTEIRAISAANADTFPQVFFFNH